MKPPALRTAAALLALLTAVFTMDFNYTPGDDDQESPAKYITAVVTAQPAAAVGVIGGQVQYTFTFTAALVPEFTFQWQIQAIIDNGTPQWSNLVETTGYYEGVTTQTLTVKAIDNFLANRPNCNFRCRLLFAGAAPSFTTGAALTVPVRTDWSAEFYARGQATTGDAAVLTFVSVPTPNFAGPYTYSWDVSGLAPNLTCDDPTGSSPTWSWTMIPPGAIALFTRCTISNGSQSVVTDRIALVSFGRTAATSVWCESSVPPTAPEGASIDADRQIVDNWAVTGQINLRRGATAPATPSTPSHTTTRFSVNNQLDGGQAVICVGWVPCEYSFPPLVEVVVTGAVSWRS